ncbi:flavin monoamine oxidase family protein [Allostreptomyces psammosilenae]|nr:FAD-dependent oxidoreductase [Allostreptomyces psammosilenae]
MFATMGALGLAPTAHAAGTEAPFRAPSASDFSLTGRSAASVVILGGGVAGLATAYELGKAGYRCTVLEARDVAGGRNFTVRGGTRQEDLDGNVQTARFSDGVYFNAGPGRIAQWMNTMDYCRELGVELEVFSNTNASAYIYNEKAGMRPGAPMRYRTAKADVYGYVSELLAKAADQGALDARLTADDKERLLEFLRDFGDIGGRVAGDPAASWRYTGGQRRGLAADPGGVGEPGTPLGPVPDLSTVLASGVGRYFSFEFGYDQAMLMFQPVGGMDAIPRALARAIGGRRIQLGCAVTRVTDRATDVVVEYRDAGGRTRSITADYCVSALPPHIMARIPHNLGGEVNTALNALRPSSAGKIGLEYRSRWWETDHDIYGGITETDMDLAHIWYPSNGFHSRRGLIVGYYNTGANADAYTALSPADREKRAVAQGVKIHGEKYRTELAHSFSIAWRRTPYLESAWNYPTGGQTIEDLTQLTEPTGRVYFTGDWLSHAVAWQHGSFSSARQVVTRLHSRVMAG